MWYSRNTKIKSVAASILAPLVFLTTCLNLSKPFFDSQPFQVDPPGIQCHQNYSITLCPGQPHTLYAWRCGSQLFWFDNYLDLGGLMHTENCSKFLCVSMFVEDTSFLVSLFLSLFFLFVAQLCFSQFILLCLTSLLFPFPVLLCSRRPGVPCCCVLLCSRRPGVPCYCVLLCSRRPGVPCYCVLLHVTLFPASRRAVLLRVTLFPASRRSVSLRATLFPASRRSVLLRVTACDCVWLRVTLFAAFRVTACFLLFFLFWFWIVFGFKFVATSIKPPVVCLGYSQDARLVLELEVQLGICGKASGWSKDSWSTSEFFVHPARKQRTDSTSACQHWGSSLPRHGFY